MGSDARARAPIPSNKERSMFFSGVEGGCDAAPPQHITKIDNHRGWMQAAADESGGRQDAMLTSRSSLAAQGPVLAAQGPGGLLR